ncbi:MAG: FadR family transcriptional regulator [Spirochaetia bacterium]|nr:FadR family transcriptional regulator [Spirochaetia bacterium]
MTHDDIEPLRARSLKDEFIERFEALILSGRFTPGQRVPSERELGTLFGVSRPVVHEGLRALEGRGLVTIESRRGVRVNDYRREGSIEMLLSILNYTSGRLSPELMNGILEMRLLFEAETARLAATRRTKEHLSALRDVLRREQAMVRPSVADVSLVDYDFHLAVAIASGNQIYPLLLNSFKRIYRTILEQFYTDPAVIRPVFEYHAALVGEIAAGREDGARDAMLDILRFGESNLRRIMGDQRPELRD